MENLLEISEVIQSFRSGFWMKSTEVLHGVTFQVPKGSVFGFLGANGAGKTTLIHLIAGFRRPIRGSVKLFGLNATSKEARSRMGYLPERPYFHEHLTGEATLTYYGTLAGLSRSDIRSRIPIVLESVGMSHAKHVELKRYSKGMLQRIGIAQALIHNPEFLVLDEPMSGLDPVGRKEIRELIEKLSSDGKTIFFSSHVIPDVEAICDRVALIHQGHLKKWGLMDEFLYSGSNPIEIAYRLTDSQIKVERVEGQAAVDQWIGKLISQKAQILSVIPIRSSLETYFELMTKQGESPT